MPRPTLEEIRAVAHPEGLLDRRSAEHWAGRLWARRVSIRITRLLAGTRAQPNPITILMIGVGLAGAAALLVAGLWGVILCAVGVQVYLLLDCVDGELARWRGTTSLKGAYLDRLGHFVVEAAIFGMYGYHVTQTWASGWTSLGLATTIVMLIAKLETDLIGSVGGSHDNGLTTEQLQPRSGSLRTLRAWSHPLKIHRLSGAVEASLFMVFAAAVSATGWDDAERAAQIVFAVVAIGLAFGHAAAILNSRRLD